MSIASAVVPPGPVRTHVLEYSSPKVKGNVIHGVKIIGCESANGYSYPVPVLREAMVLYEEAPVFVLHGGALEKKRGSRQLTDYLGNLKNVRQKQNGKGIYADLHVKLSHPMAEVVLQEAAGKARLGLSHNAIVDMNEDMTEAVEIIAVDSVDLTDKPATTKNLFESENQMATETETTDPARLDVLEEKLDKIVAFLEKAPDPKPKRITALEEITEDEQDAPPIGNSHEDFMGVLHGFPVTNTKGK